MPVGGHHKGTDQDDCVEGAPGVPQGEWTLLQKRVFVQGGHEVTKDKGLPVLRKKYSL